MAQDLRKVLSLPFIFDLFQKLVSRKDTLETFINQYVQPRQGMAILDIGCGTGKILKYLPDGITYKGYDISPEYIDAARKNYGSRGSFVVGDAAHSLEEPAESYDIAMTIGVLHHLDDATVSAMLTKVSRILKPGGRFISIDGVYTDGQSWIARRILDADRGEHVRKKDGYLNLAQPHFTWLDHTILHNLLRIPYTHIIMVGHK
jgi:ubiquinone/menaquinone biosynthesis C-methylase UbiE